MPITGGNLRGPTGAQGPAGAAGAAGATGPTGPQGPGLDLSTLGGVSMLGPASGQTLDYTLYTNTTGGPVLLSGVLLRVSQALVGSGAVALTIGTSAGGTEFLASQSLTSATAAGIYGAWQTQLGSRFLVAQDYNAVLNAGESVIARMVGSGTITQTLTLNGHVLGLAA